MPAGNLPQTEILDSLNRVISQAKRLGMALPGWIELPTFDIKIPGWLAAVPSARKYYWRSRDGRLEIGGTGLGFSLADDSPGTASSKAEEIMNLLPEFPIFFLSRKNFESARRADQLWAGFPDDLRIIPEQMIVRRNRTFSRVCCVPVMPDSNSGDLAGRIIALYESAIMDDTSKEDYLLPLLTSRTYSHDFEHWRKNVGDILAAIASGRIEKVVLARRGDYRFERPVDALALLRELIPRHPGSFASLCQPRPGSAFISVSPERLYRRVGLTLEIDALSSTVPRGGTAAEDERLRQELLKSDKQRHEHAIVIDGIKRDIRPLCEIAVGVGNTDILALERVQHLVTPITGRLRGGVSDQQILSALHPTPAVGGVPRAKALELISNLEGFDRGWYAAPIGVISRDFAEFAVAIRSALVRDDVVSVFTGAGIVAGSDPEIEWQEIDHKDILRPLTEEGIFS